jgi:dCTP deaminase
MDGPWRDWVPGVLSKVQMSSLCENGFLVNLKDPEIAIGASSVDLHLSSQAYETVRGSVKPFGDQYRYKILGQKLITEFQISDDQTFTLRRGKTYLFALREKLENVFRLAAAGMYGQATPKSSVGRMDVLARLIVDHMDSYDGFEPQRLKESNGDMFLEITPISFDVRVRPDDSLCQLRFIYGRPEDCELRGPQVAQTTLGREARSDGSLSVDLEPISVGKSQTTRAAAFRTKDNLKQDVPFDLWKKPEKERPDPREYWEPESADKATRRLTIKVGSFYILRSKERIRVPSGIAVYCRAVDETIGEMRIHYAGFVHPGFGMKRTDSASGTPLIFEVRGHDLDVSLNHSETMARLHFYRMSQDLDPEPSTYNEQTLKLSDFFSEWP